MGIPASSFFMGTLFEGPDAVVVAVFRDFTIQIISEIKNMKKRTVMMASKACFAAIDPPTVEESLA